MPIRCQRRWAILPLRFIKAGSPKASIECSWVFYPFVSGRLEKGVGESLQRRQGTAGEAERGGIGRTSPAKIKYFTYNMSCFIK